MPAFTLEFHNFLFYFISFFWIVENIVFKSQYKGIYCLKKKSFQSVFIVISTIIFGTLLYNQFELFLVPSDAFIFFNYVGVFIYSIGLYLRYYTSFILGKNLIHEGVVNKDFKLVYKGPYRLLAHPQHLGLFLLVLAIPVYFGQIIWILAALLFFGKVTWNHMKADEKMLEKSHNESYPTWLKKRYRFIPWVF